MEYYKDKFFESEVSFYSTPTGYSTRKAYHVFINNIQFPVPPQKIVTTIHNKNTTIDLVNGGELNTIRSPGLTDISMDLIIPNRFDKSYCFGFDRRKGFNYQHEYFSYLEGLKRKGKDISENIFELAILKPSDGLGDSIFELCTLEDYEIDEDAEYGPGGQDIKVKCVFKKYEKPKIITLEVVSDEVEEEVTMEETEEEELPPESDVPETYTVVAGDNLMAIAKKFLGDSNRYTDIASWNNIANPNHIVVGQVLKLSG